MQAQAHNGWDGDHMKKDHAAEVEQGSAVQCCMVVMDMRNLRDDRLC